MKYQLVLLITDYADTPDVRVDRVTQYSLSPLFDTLEDAISYARGRGHMPMTVTSEDIEGIRYRRLVEYDIIDSEGGRLYQDADSII